MVAAILTLLVDYFLIFYLTNLCLFQVSLNSITRCILFQRCKFVEVSEQINGTSKYGGHAAPGSVRAGAPNPLDESRFDRGSGKFKYMMVLSQQFKLQTSHGSKILVMFSSQTLIMISSLNSLSLRCVMAP
jgi:hypothetical protein